MTERDMTKPKVALVIGSGGLKSAEALGVFEKLEEENIGVDMVVGCSGGAVIGALIVTGHSYEESIDKVKRMWDPDLFKQFRLRNILKIFFPRLMGFNERFGVIGGRMFVDQFRKGFGEKTTFKDTIIPFYCVATNIKNGEPVVISRGSVPEAIRMSSGFPVLFEAWEHEDLSLSDGGLSNPLPVDVAIREGADIIIAVGSQLQRLPNLTSVGSFIGQTFSILTNELLSLQMGFYSLAHRSELVMIVPEFEEDIKLGDVHKVPMIIQKGREEIQKHISYIRRLMDKIDEKES